MKLEDHLEFIGDRAIRIAGTRVGIETVLNDYREGASPEEIVMRYPALSLLQVHATITYYLSHRQEVDAYLTNVFRQQEDAWLEQQQHPSAFVCALRQRLEKQQQSLVR